MMDPLHYAEKLNFLPAHVRAHMLRGTFIHPDAPKPVSEDAIRQRKTAIRDGAVCAPPRDEWDRMLLQAEVDMIRAQQAAEAEAEKAATAETEPKDEEPSEG